MYSRGEIRISLCPGGYRKESSNAAPLLHLRSGKVRRTPQSVRNRPNTARSLVLGQNTNIMPMTRPHLSLHAVNNSLAFSPKSLDKNPNSMPLTCCLFSGSSLLFRKHLNALFLSRRTFECGCALPEESREKNKSSKQRCSAVPFLFV